MVHIMYIHITPNGLKVMPFLLNFHMTIRWLNTLFRVILELKTISKHLTDIKF